jgi:hypothetical protein
VELETFNPIMVWNRLTVIASEDVGPANPVMPVVIETLEKQYFEARDKSSDSCRLFLTNAVIILARSRKSRIVDDLLNTVYGEIQHEDKKLPIPDYALDMHTYAGKIEDRSILARNRFTNETIEIDNKKLCYGVRRASGMKIINISDSQDFVVVEPFQGIERLLPSKSVQNFKKHSGKWKQYVESRFGRFLVSRRFNLSAIGTHFLAYYSKAPTTGQNLWSLKGANDDEARILSLWFNSTLNLLQVYLHRVETEGAWMEINDGMLNDFLFFDISSLSKNEKKRLLDLFEKIGKTESPSILDQLRTQYAPRKELDTVLLQLLGYSSKETDQLLDYLYPALTNEIKKLKTLMEG